MMTALHDNTGKMKKKYGHFPIELSNITFNDEQSNDQRPIINNDINVQTNQTGTAFNDEERNDQRQLPSEDIKNKCDSSHRLDNLQLNSNRPNILEQSQGAVAMAMAVAVAMEDSDHTQVDSMTRNRRVVEVTAEEFNLSTVNSIEDIRAELGPIVGYAQEPLLPLYKACAPLTDIVHNLNFYVQAALNETPEVPPDGLTIDESAAIRLYTIEWNKPYRGLYSMLNHTLKDENREHLRPYFKYLKLLLTALAKLPCVPPSTVWRGVTKDASADFPPNTPTTSWAFSSCTTALPVLENNTYLGNTGNRTLFSVETINGRKIRAHSHFSMEDEILLLPGTHMIVQSQFSPAPDLHMIHLRQVIPETVLLEPPFEGTFNIANYLF
jgi:hypothetical protein